VASLVFLSPNDVEIEADEEEFERIARLARVPRLWKSLAVRPAENPTTPVRRPQILEKSPGSLPRPVLQ
jgi:hypothetical protein